jgi:hypothetical protein
MDKWQSIAENKIKEAMEEGAFDNLAGAGKPLNLEEDPFEDPSMRMAHRLLRNNGFAPPWIEERKDLLLAIEHVRAASLRLAGNDISQRDALRRRIGELNRRIQAYNVKAPSMHFHIALRDIDP